MLIHLEKLGKTFGEKVVLHDVTASVEREDRIGIVGQNGAGKTTLLKILTGEYQDYEGEFSVTHGVTLGYLEQNAKLDATLDIYGEMRATFAPVLDAMAQMQILERRMAAQPDNADLLAQHDALQNQHKAADRLHIDRQCIHPACLIMLIIIGYRKQGRGIRPQNPAGNLQHRKRRKGFKAFTQLRKNLFGSHVVHKGHQRRTHHECTRHNNAHHAQHLGIAVDNLLNLVLTHTMLAVIYGQLLKALVEGRKHHLNRVNAQHQKAQHNVENERDNSANAAVQHQLHRRQMAAHALAQNEA